MVVVVVKKEEEEEEEEEEMGFLACRSSSPVQQSLQGDTLISGAEGAHMISAVCKVELEPPPPPPPPQLLTSQLEADPKLIHHDIGLTPGKVPSPATPPPPRLMVPPLV